MASQGRPGGKRLFVDMSHTFRSGLNSGVQRVVRNLAIELPKVCEGKGVDCIPVAWRDTHFHSVAALESDKPRETFSELASNLHRRFPHGYQKIAESIYSAIPMKFIEKQLLPKPGRLGIFAIPIRIQSQWHRMLDTLDPPNSRIRFHPGDVLLLPDGYWVMPRIWKSVAKAKHSGVHICVLVHDIIATTHPDCFVPGSKEKFERYLENVLKNADMVISTSRTVADQLKSELIKYMPKGASLPRIVQFRLGSDIKTEKGSVRQSLRELFQDSITPYLSVSTIEPRKNYAFALQAMEEIWRSNPSVRWVIAGRIGWLSEKWIENARQHPEYGKRFYIFHDLSDTELNHAYERARGVICPSIAEGFGLPIVEALWHRRHVFASDIGIHREVGGAHCEYFSLNEPCSLASKILSWENKWRGSMPEPGPEYTAMSWRNSANDLLNQLSPAGVL